MTTPTTAPMTKPMTKPRTAIAAVYDAPNTPFVLRRFPLRPVKRGEVLVRVTMSTICRSDIHSYEGRRPNPCPGILGHEIIGRIEAIGDGIETDMRGDPLSVGDRITGANISSTANAITAKSSTCRRSARACANTATTS